MERNNDRCGVSIDIPVRFAETDQMGVVHHGAYAVWLEAGRIAWLDAAGMPYIRLTERGYNFAVTMLTIQYRTPARFGDTVCIISSLETLRTRQIAFEYQVRNSVDDDLLAIAHTEHICVNENNQMARIPNDLYANMRVSCESLERNRPSTTVS